VLKGAKLILGTSSVLDCLVHNLTNRGATIEIANAADLMADGQSGRADLHGESATR
jgi:hypothetical protein